MALRQIRSSSLGICRSCCRNGLGSQVAICSKTSVCVGTVIVAHKSMKAQTAYNIVKGVLKNINDFKSAHRLLKKVTTPQSLATPAVVPHHSGAVKAFKEAGLM